MTTLAIGAAPAPASAARLSHHRAHHHRAHHHTPRHRHHHAHHHPPTQVIAVTGVDIASPSVPAPSPQTWHNGIAMIAIGDVPGCVSAGADPVPYLQNYAAQILRLVISPGSGSEAESLPCVSDAVSAGYKVSLVVGYDNSWTTTEILGYFQRVVQIYGEYAWAISIGNEQELNQDGSESAAQYASVWQVVEPVVASDYPQAIRVAGEISPWGLQLLQSALVIGLPGVQAVGGHPYARPHGFAPSQLAALAQAYGLPAWCSEGLAAPDSWGASIPLSSMPSASMAGIWLN